MNTRIKLLLAASIGAVLGGGLSIIVLHEICISKIGSCDHSRRTFRELGEQCPFEICLWTYAPQASPAWGAPPPKPPAGGIHPPGPPMGWKGERSERLDGGIPGVDFSFREKAWGFVAAAGRIRAGPALCSGPSRLLGEQRVTVNSAYVIREETSLR